MGIKGFAQFYKTCFEERNFNDYRGNKVVVDALFQIYKYVIAIRNNGEDMTNSDGETMSHLYAVFSYSIFLMRHGLQPIYLFDNKAPDIKKSTLNDRRKLKDKSLGVCQNTKDEDKSSHEYIKNYKRSFVLKDKHIYDCQRLLTAMGIPSQQCIGEADPQCAALSCDDTIMGVVGDDTDIIVFGTKLLLRDFSGKKKKTNAISMESILNYLQNKSDTILLKHGKTKKQFKHENFVDFSILMGTDYTPHIKGFSNEELFSFYVLSDMNMPETIKLLLNDVQTRPDKTKVHHYHIPHNFIEEWSEARKYYLDTPVIHPTAINKLLSAPNRETIINILCVENNFDKSCVSEMITELEDMYAIFKNLKLSSKDSFSSFKSYQLKYHSTKTTKNQFKPRQYKLLLKPDKKINNPIIYDIDSYDFNDESMIESQEEKIFESDDIYLHQKI